MSDTSPRQIPKDPLKRFQSLYLALDEDRAWWKGAARLRFAALAAVSCEGSPTRVAREIRAMDEDLRRNLGWLSSLPEGLRIVVAAFLVRHGESAAAFVEDFEGARELFRAVKLRRSRQHELIAALVLRSRDGRVDADSARRMKRIFYAMKGDHPFLTGVDDLPACALLAGLAGGPEDIASRVEELYRELVGRRQHRGNALQSAACILALADERPSHLGERFNHIQVGFREVGLWMMQGDYDELAVLAFLPQATDEVVARVLKHREAIARLRPRPDRQGSFSLASSTAFLDLAGAAGLAGEIVDVKALVDMLSILRRQQAAAAGAGAGAG